MWSRLKALIRIKFKIWKISIVKHLKKSFMLKFIFLALCRCVVTRSLCFYIYWENKLLKFTGKCDLFLHCKDVIVILQTSVVHTGNHSLHAVTPISQYFNSRFIWRSFYSLIVLASYYGANDPLLLFASYTPNVPLLIWRPTSSPLKSPSQAIRFGSYIRYYQ